MVDSSGLLEIKGRGVPDLFLISSLGLLIFLIADLSFSGFRAGELGQIVTSLIFIITLVSYIALSERTIISEGNILDGALGFTLGWFVLNIGNIFGGFQFSILSSPTSSYLAGIIGQGAQTIIQIINVIFAPLGETFLIFGLAAGIWQIVKRTDLADLPPWQLVLIVGTIPSLIFAGLHGFGRGPSFLLLAFGINLFWTSLIVYGEFDRIPSKYIPTSLGLISGLHVGFNSSSAFSNGILGFLGLMLDSLGGPQGRSAFAILVFFGITLLAALVRFSQILESEGLPNIGT